MAAHKPRHFMDIVQQAFGWLRAHKRVVQFVVVALIAVFLALGIRTSWTKLSQYQWHVQWELLAVALLVFVAQELTYALIWRGILRRLGSDLDIVSSQRIYLSAEFVRYIPGNVWHVFARVFGAESRGVPKPIGLASMVIELATKITSAALVFALSLLFWPDVTGLTRVIPRDVIVGIGLVGVPLLLVGLHPRLLQGILNRGLRMMRREPVTLGLRYRDLLVITGYWAMSWVVGGIGFYLLIRSLTNTPSTIVAVVLAIGINAMGWDVGFLAILTPSGLGFREAAIAGLLIACGLVSGADASLGVALVVAFMARLLTTGAELICVTVAHLAPGGIRVQPPTAEPAPES
ncbi:MAG TPA: lysylphosphatidylglycerol synthase transmembrane domain-containing protein [Ktedonobacterales bacterium]|jgi:glycosyltransferase 2 family protein|nr:lysylphosphatidylglycerol synthase transmembrane domain-containing protein [Ktedonobacterales bacterium]